ncbi:SOUL family heme-binding protein [Methylolobus aquaticus]
MATEQPQYDVLQRDENFELRRYAPYTVAETEVSGDFEAVGNEAFRILAGYIFGNNETSAKIAMTAPVSQTPAAGSGERIAMTAPVSQSPRGNHSTPLCGEVGAGREGETVCGREPAVEPPGTDSRRVSASPPAPARGRREPIRPRVDAPGSYTFTFTMPSGYTLETLPRPTDSRVRLRRIDARVMAARTFSGTWSEARYREHETALLQAVRAAGLEPVGLPVFARYNSPFTLWFLRRNEVLVEVAPEGLVPSEEH